MNKTGIIILAAGSSSRFGKPKQLLCYNGKTFIQHVVDEAVDASLNPVVMVTGANAVEVSAAVNNAAVKIIYNKHWQQGMASGIVAGVHALLSVESTIKNIIIAVCDQPFITADLFKALYSKQQETGKNIIACYYADTTGTPVLFTQKYFTALQQLKGEDGAKKLLRFYKDEVDAVAFPKGNIDIDTTGDYESC